MDEKGADRENHRMARYRFTAYLNDGSPRYVVLWDLQWNSIECQRLEAGADLRAAMQAAMQRLAAQGWRMESAAEYGFVFIRRDAERRLLTLTARDPSNHSPQTFSPFRT
jgi:hypothetical protein